MDRIPLSRGGVITVAVAMGLCGLGSLHGVVRALASLNLPGPVTDLVTEAPPPPVTPPRKVLVVLIDGLRADVAWSLPFVGQLAAGGARADLWVDPPSYSSAQYVAFLTGVSPRDSGVRTNAGFAPVALDNLPRRLAAAGRTAREVGDEVDWWRRLFGADFTDARLVAPDGLLAAAREAMAASDLTLVHLCAVDRMGHRRGGASVEYHQAARDQDRKLHELALAFGWPASPVVVLSDHGHTMHGGHGGDEPEVRRAFLVVGGAGARAHAGVVQARSVDVAPTLAALLGVAAPANAEGRVLDEMLDLGAPARQALVAADRARITRAAAAAADGWRRHHAGEQWPRLARGAALLAVAVVLAWAVRGRGPHVRAGLGAGLASLLLVVAAFFARYRRLSFSADRDVTELAVTTAVIGTLAAAVALGPRAIRLVRRRSPPGPVAARCAGVFAGGSPVAALVFVAVGAGAPRLACEPGWLAAGPLVAYALFTPLALAAALLAAVSSGYERADRLSGGGQ